MITEHTEGENICKKFLASSAEFMVVADKMVEIADYYNMDGWLLNIENKIQVRTFVPG